MPQRPLRFIHAADLHLDRPVHGLTEAPEHLVDLLIDAPARAAVKVFDAAIDQRADFLVLAGGIVNPRHASPYEIMLLAEQFERLNAASIAVYWALGPRDGIEASVFRRSWPANVHLFPRGCVKRMRHEIDGTMFCEIIGRSHDDEGSGTPAEWEPIDKGHFSIAVVHADFSGNDLRNRGIDYWALGGNPARSTPLHMAGCVAHYPGTPQGRTPNQTDPHGCTLVRVSEAGECTLAPINCDLIRWHAPHITLTATASRNELETSLRQQTSAILGESHCPAMIQWRVSCSGPLSAALRAGQLNSEMTAMLRSEFGHRSPLAWTIGVAAELPYRPPIAWREEDSLRGDFLKGIDA